MSTTGRFFFCNFFIFRDDKCHPHGSSLAFERRDIGNGTHEWRAGKWFHNASAPNPSTQPLDAFKGDSDPLSIKVVVDSCLSSRDAQEKLLEAVRGCLKSDYRAGP